LHKFRTFLLKFRTVFRRFFIELRPDGPRDVHSRPRCLCGSAGHEGSPVSGFSSKGFANLNAAKTQGFHLAVMGSAHLFAEKFYFSDEHLKNI
jgi:hypothetical protein